MKIFHFSTQNLNKKPEESKFGKIPENRKFNNNVLKRKASFFLCGHTQEII